MVYGRGSSGGSDGLHPGARLHGHQALRLRHLGADSAAARRGIQAHRPPEREHADAHSGEPAAQGSGSRRGLRAGSRVGHAGRPRRARRSSARCTPSGCRAGATCRSNTTSGAPSCAGRRRPARSCARPSSSGRRVTPSTPPPRRRRRRRCRCCTFTATSARRTSQFRFTAARRAKRKSLPARARRIPSRR